MSPADGAPAVSEFEAGRLLVDLMSLAAVVISAAAGWYAWHIGRYQVRDADIDQKVVRLHERIDEVADDARERRQGLEDRLASHAGRIVAAEQELRHMPQASQFQELSKALGHLHGDLRELRAEFKGFKELSDLLRRQVELMDEWLKTQAREAGR